MKTGTLLPATSRILCVGLLALAGVLFDAPPASAQSQEVCPLPAGVTPPADPSVTAQQVENGTGSLMEFALSSRDRVGEQARETRTLGQGPYIGCLIRQEGGPWRSGSTYLVNLTLDGRVLVHAKDMSLSGG